jgi:hypothetical protein
VALLQAQVDKLMKDDNEFWEVVDIQVEEGL